MPPRSELANQRFGKLVAIRDTGSNTKGSRLWLCNCDCGKTTTVASHELKRGRTRSCGCLRIEILDQIRPNPTLPDGIAARNQRLARYKNSATSRNLEWTLSNEDFFELARLDCFYCGAQPSNKVKSLCSTGDYIYNGVDRANNSKGYTKDNCVPCCKTCNYMKKDLTEEEFLSHIQQIINYQKQKESTCY